MRGKIVLLDKEVAKLCGVSTKRLNEIVKRNHERLPEDFAFRLNSHEMVTFWRSQFATSKKHTKRYMNPYRHKPIAFTERGICFVATIIKTPQALHLYFKMIRTLPKQLPPHPIISF